ncbi:MAG: hypothetical protein HYT48_02725 [Candidatus Vogelbacteria bacterium]|nr:hypothetical protein [Candidatus Vogelbacteria bacterium]
MSEEQIVYNPGEESYLREQSKPKRRFSDRTLVAVAVICFVAAAVIFYNYR